MTYFNGSLHGYNSVKGFIPPVPTTEVYCDTCGPDNITGWNKEKPYGQQHHDSGFRWVPVYGGDEKCHSCGGNC